MIPWVHLDTARVPDGEELRLKQRGPEFSIMLGSNELMNSRLSGSEEALATLAIAKLSTPAPRVLIGGLGMGFTLRAALGVLGPQARVVVAELVPAVVRWARGPMAAIYDGCLDDQRTDLYEGDVGALIRSEKAAWDALLLDVDNGPDGLSRAGNDALYDPRGLAQAFASLRHGGVLAVWSSGPDRRFTRSLERAGFGVDETSVRARGKGRGGARHTIWLATKA